MLDLILKILRHALDWWRSPKRYVHLFRTIRKVKPKVIVEIGTWTGDRALSMLKEASHFHPARELTYIGFDLFEELTPALLASEISKQPPSKAQVKAKLEKTGATVRLFQGNTLQTLPQAVDTLPQADFVFIDGGHSLETIESDWRCAQKLMHKGTIVVFDDYWINRTDAGAKPIVDTIDRKKYNVRVLGRTDKFENTPYGPLHIRFAEAVLK